MPKGIYKHKKGKEAHTYIDGRYSKKYYYIEPDCNNEICYINWLYGKKGVLLVLKKVKEVTVT